MSHYRFCFFIVFSIIGLSACETNIPQDNQMLKRGKDEISLNLIAQALGAPELKQYMYLESYEGFSVASNSELTFILKPNQKELYGGIRSELSIDYPYRVGDKVRYKFRFKIPEGFTPDVSLNRWWIVAQWHDQPDPSLNQTWRNFPSNSPPVFMFLKEVEGKVGVGINYGGQEDFWYALNPNEWYDFKFDFLWSDGPEGKMKMEINSSALINFEGANMLNNYQHYLKIGMYRHPEINTFNRVFFKNLSIKKILES